MKTTSSNTLSTNLSHSLLSLSWKTIQLTYEYQQDGVVPSLKASALRGMMGHELKEHAPDIYEAIFAPKAKDAHPYCRRYREIPPPYIISVPDRRRRVKKGGKLVAYLTLIGKAEDHFPGLLAQMEYLGGRGLGPSNIPMSLCGLHMKQLKMNPVPNDPFQVHIDYRTPLVIRNGEGGTTMPSFPLLVHRIAERCAVLAHFHGGSDLITAFEDWIELAKKSQMVDAKLFRHTWKRYSQRSGHHMAMTGWVGQMILKEVDKALIPLLWFGSCLHVGKGTTWGMGRYELRWEIE